MQDPRKLLVLEKAHVLLVDVNEAAGKIKGTLHAELRRQLFKSSLSVVSNTAEGRNKDSDREFLRYLKTAFGSAGELEAQVRVIADCRLIPSSEAEPLKAKASEVARMLNGLIEKIERDLGRDAGPDDGASNDTESDDEDSGDASASG
jgi:four helix bundle protein